MLRRELFGGALLLLPLMRARAESCGVADPNEIAPFYRAGAPERAVLHDEGQRGERYQLQTRVLGEGCVPIAGALGEVWQGGEAGGGGLAAPRKPRGPP